MIIPVDVEELKQEIKILKKENEKLKTANNGLLTDNSNLKSANTNLTNQNSNLISTNNKLSSENWTLRSSNNSLSNENSNLRSSNNSLSNENDRLRSTSQTSDALNNRLNSEVYELREKNAQLSNRKIWMPWIILMHLLFLQEGAALLLCLAAYFIMYEKSIMSIIALSIISFATVLSVIINVVYFAKQKCFKNDAYVSLGIFRWVIWIVLELLVLVSSFLAFFNP